MPRHCLIFYGFRYAFRSVVLPAFAHNPQIVHQTFKNGTEKFVLFHIGHGGIHAADTPEGPFVPVVSTNNRNPYGSLLQQATQNVAEGSFCTCLRAPGTGPGVRAAREIDLAATIKTCAH